MTRRKKYKIWHIHTTAIQILPIGTFFIAKKPIAITTVTIPIILHFAIDGDYAHLRRNDIEPEDNETKLVARALLPPEIMEGSILKYEMLQYEIIG